MSESLKKAVEELVRASIQEKDEYKEKGKKTAKEYKEKADKTAKIWKEKESQE